MKNWLPSWLLNGNYPVTSGSSFAMWVSQKVHGSSCFHYFHHTWTTPKISSAQLKHLWQGKLEGLTCFQAIHQSCTQPPFLSNFLSRKKKHMEVWGTKKSHPNINSLLVRNRFVEPESPNIAYRRMIWITFCPMKLRLNRSKKMRITSLDAFGRGLAAKAKSRARASWNTSWVVRGWNTGFPLPFSSFGGGGDTATYPREV